MCFYLFIYFQMILEIFFEEEFGNKDGFIFVNKF